MYYSTKKEVLLSEYLSFYLNSPEGVAALVGETVDVARANVSLASIKSLMVLCPSLIEQVEIVRQVEQLFAFADLLEAKVSAAHSRIDKLTKSILAKAFRGWSRRIPTTNQPTNCSLESRLNALLQLKPNVRTTLRPDFEQRSTYLTIVEC